MILMLKTHPPFITTSFKKELRKKRYLLPDDYTSPPVDGLPSLELEAGRSGPPASLGDTVTVHFDVVWRGIDVSSSRAARLLGANRSLPEPYTFVVGAPVTAAAARKASGEGGGGGLFAGGAGPQPPAALSTAVVGMRVGGKRAVLVPAGERGYGDKRVGEAPPGVDLELRIEVLDVAPKAG